MKLSTELGARLLNADLLPDEVVIGGNTLAVHSPVATGVSGVVWKCRDDYGRDRAVKLAIREHYDRRSYLEEMSRASRLEPYSQFARLQYAAITKVSFKDGVEVAL
jgi:hypothetical protein